MTEANLKNTVHGHNTAENMTSCSSSNTETNKESSLKNIPSPAHSQGVACLCLQVEPVEGDQGVVGALDARQIHLKLCAEVWQQRRQVLWREEWHSEGGKSMCESEGVIKGKVLGWE